MRAGVLAQDHVLGDGAAHGREWHTGPRRRWRVIGCRTCRHPALVLRLTRRGRYASTSFFVMRPPIPVPTSLIQIEAVFGSHARHDRADKRTPRRAVYRSAATHRTTGCGELPSEHRRRRLARSAIGNNRCVGLGHYVSLFASCTDDGKRSARGDGHALADQNLKQHAVGRARAPLCRSCRC